MRDFLLAIQCISIVGLFTECWAIFQRMKSRLHYYLFLSCISALVINTGYILEITSKTEEAFIAALKFAYLGRAWYAFFLFLFTMEFVRVKLPGYIKKIMILVHAFTYVVILMFPGNRLYYTDWEFVTDGLFPYMKHGNGPLHHLHMFFQVFYIVLGLSFLFLAHRREKNPKMRRRLFMVILAFFTESAFFIAQLSGIYTKTGYYDVSNIGYFIASMIMLVAILSLDLLGTNDIAREFVIDRISEGIIAVDNDDRIQYFNEPAAKLFPELDKELTEPRKHGRKRLGEQEILSTIREAIEKEENIMIDERLYRPDENELMRDGVKFGKLYALVDETEHIQYLKELEKEKENADKANVAKSRFLARMSHEIRTPINAVLGMDEMILRESGEKTIRDYAGDIMAAGKTLMSLINDILDFSKAEEGQMKIIPVQYEVSSLINDLVNMIRDRAVKKGLKFTVEAEEGIPHLLNGDELRIRQCVMNILTNAVKYTETGSVKMQVSYKKAATSRDHILLSFSVEDTGIGMHKEDMEKLFSPYERIDEERNRAIEGTGLGMSITRQLLELMGTQLCVESEYGKGSTFSFEVEQEVVSWDKIGDYNHRLVETGSEEKGYRELFHAPKARILVVDDTEMNLTVIKSLLKKTDIHIDTALSGKDALMLAAVNKYDAVFIDHMMFEMDGIETLSKLRKEGKNRETPAVALTANAISGAREMYLEAGFDDYLSKPVDGEKLERMLYNILPVEKIQAVDKNERSTIASGPARSKILVVDDDESVCALIKSIMEPAYDIEVCMKGAEAPKKARDIKPELIILDVHLADRNGFELMREFKACNETADIPVLMVTGDNDADTEENGLKCGASDYIVKPFVPDVLKQRAKHIIDLHRYQRSIEDEVERQTNRSMRLGREMMFALSKTVDTKDFYTDGHSRRVAALCAEIGRRMGKNDFEQVDLYEVGLLHDIGKIGIHEDIIHKKCKLSDDEFAEIKEHTIMGYNILKEISDMPMLCEGARWHHEKYNGTGYPDGLKGEEIPECARITCVADCYDAMTSTRTYSKPKTREEVRAEFVRCRGVLFDPNITDVMLAMIDEDEDYRINEKAFSGEVWKEYNRLWKNMDYEEPAYEEAVNVKLRIAAEGEDAAVTVEEDEKLPDYLYSISELNVEEGLKNCGSAQGYMSVLSVFKQTAGPKAEEIEGFYNAEDIQGYTVKVHALKSSARIIGAAVLSKLAEQLEFAGKQDDKEFIKENTDKLLKMYRELDKELSADDCECAEKAEISSAELKEAFQTVIEIADAMDYGLMDQLLKSLHDYDLESLAESRLSELEKLLSELDWEGMIKIAKEAYDSITEA